MQTQMYLHPCKTLVLAGNPNVGKSTIFNHLTGLNQHTGNWPGKTVECKTGKASRGNRNYRIVDTPGTYSLLPSSEEEAVTRDFLVFGQYDCVIVVADATCLERNLQLALAVRELTPRMVLCVNLADEAERRGIHISAPALRRALGVPVVITSARSGKGISALLAATDSVMGEPAPKPPGLLYPAPLEEGLHTLAGLLHWSGNCRFTPRYLAVRLLEGEQEFLNTAALETGLRLWEDPVASKVNTVRHSVEQACGKPIAELLAEATVATAEEACQAAVTCNCCQSYLEQRLDRILTGKTLGIPLMVLLLLGILWITIAGANVPSSLLEQGLNRLLEWIRAVLLQLGAGPRLLGLLCDGVLGTLFQVIAVMLPPMAIFFPLFTLLEDAGYLPRIAFNLDSFFARAGTCGKQALTMWMVGDRMPGKQKPTVWL